MTQKPGLHLIGLLPNLQWLPPAAAALIGEADILGAGDRLLNLFPGSRALKLPLRLPLDGWLEELKALQSRGRKVVVLASGDPNYYGLARKLLSVIEPDLVTVIPAPTLVQQAFARLKTGWERAEVVSLHGRGDLTAFWGALFRAARPEGSGYVAVYTDPDNTPAVIAGRLLDRGLADWRLNVFEDLGAPNERHSAWTLPEAESRRFSPLNLVVLECLKRPAHISPGLPENKFVHEAGLITKREIRAAALGLWELQPHHTLWDLGAGSGSVSIEAASLLPHGSVWAVEKSAPRAEQIAANRTLFGAAQVEVIEGRALAAMNNLPPPDRVFIGGGGAELGEIIQAARGRLRPGGLILANTLSLDSLHLAAAALGRAGLELSVTQIQAARSEPLSGGLFLKPLNQVWLVRGRAE
jgi:precorrin-6Y C5,15-methyltransferase (decarboxylating)